jgi:hypothetical protein
VPDVGRVAAVLAVTVLLAVLLAGCAIVEPRQTLEVLDDGSVAFLRGRGDVCLAVEDAAGEVVSEVCGVRPDPLEMGEAAVLPLGDRDLLLAVVPGDVTDVEVRAGDDPVAVVEVIPSDLTSGIALAELDPSLGSVTLIGRAADGTVVGTSDPVPLTDGDEPVHTRAPR